jgi:hypothetical protein
MGHVSAVPSFIHAEASRPCVLVLDCNCLATPCTCALACFWDYVLACNCGKFIFASFRIAALATVFFVAEFLCSLWNRGQNTFENSVYLLTASICRRLGLLSQGLSAWDVVHT